MYGERLAVAAVRIAHGERNVIISGGIESNSWVRNIGNGRLPARKSPVPRINIGSVRCILKSDARSRTNGDVFYRQAICHKKSKGRDI